MWDNLSAIFEDTGLTRKIGLIRTLVTTQLDSCDSMEDYVNKILTTAHKLAGIGCIMDDEWIGTFLLAGLPEHFNTMIMGIESSGLKISGDSIKTMLLQDVQTSKTESAFFSRKMKPKKKWNGKSKGMRCFKCNENGHIANDCSGAKSKGDKKKTVFGAFSAVFLSGSFGKNDWYFDSGSSHHLTVSEHWLEDKSKSNITEIIVANNTKMQVSAEGKVKIQTLVNGGACEITVNNVLFVPGLTTNLLSVSQIIKNGNSVTMNFWLQRAL